MENINLQKLFLDRMQILNKTKKHTKFKVTFSTINI